MFKAWQLLRLIIIAAKCKELFVNFIQNKLGSPFRSAITAIQCSAPVQWLPSSHPTDWLGHCLNLFKPHCDGIVKRFSSGHLNDSNIHVGFGIRLFLTPSSPCRAAPKSLHHCAHPLWVLPGLVWKSLPHCTCTLLPTSYACSQNANRFPVTLHKYDAAQATAQIQAGCTFVSKYVSLFILAWQKSYCQRTSQPNCHRHPDYVGLETSASYRSEIAESCNLSGAFLSLGF